MKTFPMFLQMQGRRVVIAGGGEQAAQKCRLILKTEAEIVVLAPDLDAELADLNQSGRIIWRAGAIRAGDFANTALVFIATGCKGADASLHALAKAAGAVVNVVDQPALCDALTPSIVDRSPVVVAIGTEGTAPVLARQIKTRLEELLEPRLGDLAAISGRLRDLAAQRLDPRARRDLWRWVFSGPVRRTHAQGGEREAAQMIKDAIHGTGHIPDQKGSLAVVDAGSGPIDLMTLRGVQRLQEADVIYYDEHVNPDILELARRDAERHAITAATPDKAWPKDRIESVIISAALQGKRVVHLSQSHDGSVAQYQRTKSALLLSKIDCEFVGGFSTFSTGHSYEDSGTVSPT